jgi:TolA-binding protein
MSSESAKDSNSPPSVKTSRSRKTLPGFRAGIRKAGRSVGQVLRSLTRDSFTKTVALVSTIALLVVGAFLVALALRFTAPRSQIIVSAFQVFPGDDKSNGQSGKALADLFVDELHHVLEEADRFHGNPFSSSKAFGGVPDMPNIPVDTSYGIEIKGVSLDQVLATWDHVRYHEYRVSGDLILGAAGHHAILVRYDTEGKANSFDSPVPETDPATLKSAVKALTLLLVKDINPEAAARFLSAQAMESCEHTCDQAWKPVVQFCLDWIKKEPNHALPFFYLGYALRHTTHPDDSLALLDHSIKLDPHLYLAYNTEGVELLNEGKYSEAESKFREGLNIHKTPNGLLNLGVVALRQGHFDEAVNYIRQALALEPDDFGAYLHLGYALRQLSKNDEAADAYLHAHHLQPGNQTAVLGRVVSLARAEKREQAVRECEEADRLDPLIVMASPLGSDKCADLASWMLSSTEEVVLDAD